MGLSRRDFLQLMAAGAAAGLGAGCAASTKRIRQIDYSQVQAVSDRIYNLKMTGNVRLLHMANLHGQLKPLYYREPNTHLGVHQYANKPPNRVGQAKLAAYGVKPNSLEAHALTHLDFNHASQLFGKVGGSEYLKTLLDQLRIAAGGIENTLTLDSGNAWQGSALALWSRGRVMVEMSNRLGVDVMTGHWDLMYADNDVLRNVEAFNGAFLSQNIRLKQKKTTRIFKPYEIKEINGKKLVIIGQSFASESLSPAFNRTSSWHFDSYYKALQTLVTQVRQMERPSIVVLLSANETAVNLTLAKQIVGLDVILGGQSYDSMPKPIKVKNDLGNCFVVSSGCYGKFVSVLDFQLSDYGVQSITYTLLPVFSNFLRSNERMVQFIDRAYQEKASNRVTRLEGTNEPTTIKQILSETVTRTPSVFYRKDDFSSPWDQVIVNSLRQYYKTPISMAVGLRFGTSLPRDVAVTIEDIMNLVAVVNGGVRLERFTGIAIKKRLEESLETRFSKDPYKRSGLDVLRTGGLTYSIAPTKGYGLRVSNLVLEGNEPLRMSRLYQVAIWDARTARSKPDQAAYIWNILIAYLRKNQPEQLLEPGAFPTLVGMHGNQGVEDYSGEML